MTERRIPRVLLVANVPTPFLVELAEAVGRLNLGWELDVWFGSGLPPHRGRHWLDGMQSHYVHCASREVAVRDEQIISLGDLVARNEYTAILSLLPLHPGPVSLLRDATRNRNLPIVFWHEPPLRRSWALKILKRVMYRILARQLQIVACFAIGHRALEEWEPIFRKPVYLVPYLQDLADEMSVNATRVEEAMVTKFVFSGQLVERNNVSAVLAAIEALNRDGCTDDYRVEFFGDGPLRPQVEVLASSVYGRNITISADRPVTWGARLKPLKACDVLLYPGIYSGWGLTVPEALALGKPVISTRGIESARFYIRDGLNGFLVEPNSEHIAQAMKYFIGNVESRARMAPYCRESALTGDVGVGSGALTELFSLLGLVRIPTNTSEKELTMDRPK